MVEELNLWHSSDVEVREKVNDVIKLLNAQQAEIEKLKLEFGGTDND